MRTIPCLAGLSWVAGGCLLLGLPSAARAQGWTKTPDGEFAYVTTFTTSGHFTCVAALAVGSCLATDNAVTITNGSASLTLTFLGVSGDLTATNVRTPMTIGTIQRQVTGVGPFTFPVVTNPNVPLFDFRIEVATTTPLASSGYWNAGFRNVGDDVAGNCCEGHHTYVQLPVAMPPAPVTYTAIIIDTFGSPVIPNTDGTMQLQASVGLVPEPSTNVLVLSGLAGVALVSWRRRMKVLPPTRSRA
jgi:hypothetical protein